MTETMKKASAQKIQHDLESLSKFNSTPGDGFTRVLFTEEELEGRAYIKTRMEELGMLVREDAVGNIFGKLSGLDSSLAPVWTGSHIDTVLHGGRFDGMAGVIAGLEAVRLIKESRVQFKRDIEVVVFMSEEPTRFRMGCLGSRVLAGNLKLADAEKLMDESGRSLAQVLRSLDYDLTQFDAVKKKRGEVHGFVELHIEQGAILERKGIPIGIVTTISAPTNFIVSVTGQQRHAGATPMEIRVDPLTASAEIILKLEQLASLFENSSTVATVGKVKVYPNASNVIPAKVEFSVDIRSSDFEDKEIMLREINYFMKQVEEERKVEISVEMICHDQPKQASTEIIKLIRNASVEENQPFLEMVSGAYHDAMWVAKFAPFGMIFVPSKNGISHDKEEWTDYEDIAKATDILAKVLLSMSQECKKI